jgi:tetraacyldisaccharide 4'-kinase
VELNPAGFVTRWWSGRAGALGSALDVALAPAEWLFRAGVAARGAGFARGVLKTERVSVPVISVGNLGVGGAGKTPFAAWLAGRLLARGRRPGIALRGYGGDEVLLHAELNPAVPVAAAARRADAAWALIGEGCDVVVLDDGFQHRWLARDLDLVLVAADSWRPGPRLLPRGPWREPLEALRRASAIVITRKTASLEAAIATGLDLTGSAPFVPLLHCQLRPDGLSPLQGGPARPLASLRGERILAVSGLAAPEPFFATLRAAGAEVDALPFPDHHAFDAGDAAAIITRAGGRVIVMTRKDAVKLRPRLGATPAWVLEQRVEMEMNAERLEALLARVLGEAG